MSESVRYSTVRSLTSRIAHTTHKRSIARYSGVCLHVTYNNMNKQEAIENMVTEMSSISQDQFKTLMEAQGEYYPLPMWGTMWRLDYFGEKLYEDARVMASCEEDIDRTDMSEEELNGLDSIIGAGDFPDEYIEEEMAGARCILDKDGNTTAMYIYELDGEYWLGVNGAGWDFYEGVWAKLYDVCGLSTAQ